MVIQTLEKGRQQSWSYGGYFLVDGHDHDVGRRFPPHLFLSLHGRERLGGPDGDRDR